MKRDLPPQTTSDTSSVRLGAIVREITSPGHSKAGKPHEDDKYLSVKSCNHKYLLLAIARIKEYALISDTAMPDKNNPVKHPAPSGSHEISLEDRLMASLRIRRVPLAHLSNPRVIGSVAALKPKPKKRKKLPVRSGGVPQNPHFLAFIRRLPCLGAGLQSTASGHVHQCSGRVEAAHMGWGAGRGQKAPDETAGPMCVNLHRTGKYANEVLRKKFWEFWGLDREILIRRYQGWYKDWLAGNLEVGPGGVVEVSR